MVWVRKRKLLYARSDGLYKVLGMGCSGFRNSSNRGYIGVIQGIYWAYIGTMENKMETTIVYGVHLNPKP